MNDNVFNLKEKQLEKEMKANGYGWINGKYIKPPKEYKLREEELNCINMINSILCYGCLGYSAEEVMQHEENNYTNYLEKYVSIFGRDKVIELIQEQINSIKEISYAVCEDSEGCVYNAIVWKD